MSTPEKLRRQGKELLVRVTEEEDEFRETHFKDVAKVLQEEEIVCTTCNENLKHTVETGGVLFYHPHLRVLMCEVCRENYSDGNFSPDEDGDDKYCRWCANGGSLFCCSKCVCTFCKKCIRNNFGREMLRELKERDFECFLCQPKLLFKSRAVCYAAVEYSRQKKKEKSLSQKKKVSEMAERKRLGLKPCRTDRKNKSTAPESNSKNPVKYINNILERESSGDLTDSDFEPKSSQRFKPCLMGKPRRSSTECTVKNEMKQSKVLTEACNNSNLSQWVLLDSLSEDVSCVANVLNEQVGKFKAKYSEISPDQTEVPIAVSDLLRYVNRAVQSLLDLQESIEAFNTDSSSKADLENGNPLKSENVDFEEENNDTEDLQGTQDSIQVIEDSDDCNESSTVEQKPSHTKASIRPKSKNLDVDSDHKTSRKLQRCGSTESESGEHSANNEATVENKENLVTTCNEHGDPSPEVCPDKTNENSEIDNESDDMFGDYDAEENNFSESLKENCESNSVIDNLTTQSKKSIDCKDSLMASSSDDSSSEAEEVHQTSMSLASKAKLLNFSGSESDSELPNTTRKSCIGSGNESASDIESLRPGTSKCSREQKKKFDIKSLDVYHSDIRLQGKCTVNIEAMDPDERNKYLELVGGYYSLPSSESDSDHSINNLMNLNGLKRKAKKSEESSESGSGNSDDTTGKKEKKFKTKLKKQDKLADFLNKTETSEAEGSFEEGGIVQPNFIDQDSGTLNDAKKQHLLQSSDSDNDLSDLNDGGKEEIPINSKKKKKDDDKTSKSDDDENICKEESNADAENNCDSGNDAKEKKKDWRHDKLLTGKLSDTDSSEEERRLQKKKAKRDDEGSSSDEVKSPVIRKSQETPQKKKKDADSDSDTSSSEDFVKKKRKVRSKKSSSSSSSESEKEKPKKKRRRIKTVHTDSSSEGEKKKEDVDDSPNKGRKKIKHILREEELEEGTKEAAKVEEERLKRISSRQSMYDQLYENVQKGFATLDTLVLDFDEKTKEPLVEVDEKLVKKLKPHQAKGVKFMWDACFESLKMIQNKKVKGSGCILAHCMGLGKTFQVVTLVHTLFKHEETNVSKVLVVCPVSTVLNWVNEFQKWLKGVEPEIEVYELTRYKQNNERSYYLKEWMEGGGVLVIGYDMYRNLANPESKRARASIMKTFQASLVDPGPDLVICDEGHLLKNEDTAISKAMTRIRTLRRIILTGTPLQNNLKEYHCMVQFVKPNLLGTKKEFCNRFVNPITNGQFEDSTAHDVKRMKRRAHVLHKTLEGSVQRFDYSVLTPFLPPKEEYVISVRLTELQEKLYSHYLEHFSSKGYQGKGAQLFADFQQLQRIWTHPRVLRMSQLRNELKAEKEDDEDSEGSLRDFIDDDEDDSNTSSSASAEASGSSDDDVVCLSDGSNGQKKKINEKNPPPGRRTRANKDLPLEPEPAPPPKQGEWWEHYLEENDLEDLRASPKIVLLFSILKDCEENGEKMLVFSQSLFSLDVIEYFLSKIDEATQRDEESELVDGHRGSWSPGIDYFRLDGSTPTDLRSTWCNIFNKTSNLKARLFLISTRAGGLGINLVAANRVVIFDASWNPSHDVQSIFRVYRFGQKKPCFIYRFLAQGTMEEKIYERQVTKLSLACRVVDEQQIERYYKMADLQELYNFTPADRSVRVPFQLPKDHLFAEILKKHESLITKYHEHDSLLENKEAEELNEEERQAAWEDYEKEKTGPVNQGIQETLEPIPTIEQLKIALSLRHPEKSEAEIQHLAQEALTQIFISRQKQQLLIAQQQQAAIRQRQYEAMRAMQMQMQIQSALQQRLPQANAYPQAMPMPYQQYQNFPQANLNFGARNPTPQLYPTNPSISTPSHSRQGNLPQPGSQQFRTILPNPLNPYNPTFKEP